MTIIKLECDSCGRVEERMKCVVLCPECYSPDRIQNQMKLLRMDFITYTNKVEHEVKMVKKEIRGIRDALHLMVKKRPDQTTKARLKQIIDILEEK